MPEGTSHAGAHAAAKAFVLDFVARNREGLKRICDSIFYFGELGMQEKRSAGLMASLLEQHGFKVEMGISGFPTAFLASYGVGSPVIAIHTEYDANPSNSQRAGVAERAEIVPGAPGHCEGHNVNAAVMIAAALALRYAMERFGLRGTLRIFGAPAEEQLVSRPYFVRDGYFDDVDVAFHDHILDVFRSDYGLAQSAAVSADFTFLGESAHAAMWPWKARDALDALVLMDMGLAQYREHMKPTMTAHRVITQGGEQPNVIPSRTSVWWYFRDPTAEGAGRLFEQAKKIAQGAALMTNCEVEVHVRAAVWPVRFNQTMAEVIQRNVEAIGVPQWTETEQDFARKLQRQAGVREDGLYTAVPPLTGPTKQIAASHDCGDVSWKVPMGRVWFPANVPHIPFHHWTGGAALATSIAHKGGEVGAKALAASVVDYFATPGLVAETRASFAREIGDVVYAPLIPGDQRAPVDLNAALMEKFRPAMEAHYPKERPEFSA
ncbi:MAG: amidohydrolase [Rhodospirillaceae bacterium]|nr:amidohydrolase [Rhodospirillaceae bacterium]